MIAVDTCIVYSDFDTDSINKKLSEIIKNIFHSDLDRHNMDFIKNNNIIPSSVLFNIVSDDDFVFPPIYVTI
jgi:5S rRNA maturation endonuclease (ribonuclease M5)